MIKDHQIPLNVLSDACKLILFDAKESMSLVQPVMFLNLFLDFLYVTMDFFKVFFTFYCFSKTVFILSTSVKHINKYTSVTQDLLFDFRTLTFCKQRIIKFGNCWSKVDDRL